MTTVDEMRSLLTALSGVLLGAGTAMGQEAVDCGELNGAPAQLPSDEVGYGQSTEVLVGIADVRLRRRDSDLRESTEYAAPPGFTVLGHEIHQSGHHSGVTHDQTTQPGRISNETGAMESLLDALRTGVMQGILLTGDGDEDSGDPEIDDSTGEITLTSYRVDPAEAAIRYADFLNEFEARYNFVADTPARVSFDWYADSETLQHGAELTACATVTLRRDATADDAARAASVIQYAIEAGESTDVYGLIDAALGVPGR